MYPAPLQDLIVLFEHLSEQERLENFIVMSHNAEKHEPLHGEKFDLEDVRKDDECTDSVGIFLRAEDDDRAHFAVTLGPKVQTLTKAMTTILCRGLNGAKLMDVLNVPADFVPRIVGTELVLHHSQSVYYLLGRMKTAVKLILERRLAAQGVG